jgi:hypothetical protein
LGDVRYQLVKAGPAFLFFARAHTSKQFHFEGNALFCPGIKLNTASNSVSRMSSKALQLYLDEEIINVKKSDWISTLVVENITIVNDFEPDKSATGTIDICQYLPGGPHHSDINPARTKLRFDSSIFLLWSHTKLHLNRQTQHILDYVKRYNEPQCNVDIQSYLNLVLGLCANADKRVQMRTNVCKRGRTCANADERVQTRTNVCKRNNYQ